ncbi:hypothetical protein JCM8202_004308 [Rhodotorula sphaerocarpa]
MSSPAPAPELEDELAAFRAQWRQEAERKRQQPASSTFASTSQADERRPHRRSDPPQDPPQSPERYAEHNAATETDEALARRLDGVTLETSSAGDEASNRRDRERDHAARERARPKSALELYEYAVFSEREGRMQDALVNYRSAFRLDPDVDRAYHVASVAAQKQTRAAEPRMTGTGPSSIRPESGEFRFERTVQLGPDYDSRHEHRTQEEAQRESGRGDADSTHPSSSAFLLRSLLKSIAENPWVRPPPTVRASEDAPTSPREGESGAALEERPSDPPSSHIHLSGTATPTITPEEALASLNFIPADEEKPLPLARLPFEVLLLVLRHLVLSSMLPPPRSSGTAEEGPPTATSHSAAPPVPRSRKQPQKRTLREEMLHLEHELELDDVDRDWRSDVEALERFARVSRAARIVTLDSSLWRALCLRTFVPPHQISRDKDALQLVKEHGSDWRRFYIEHPRLRLDGTYISVVTYLRRGEVQSIYAPTHLITFYRYLRFYHHGLVLSLLTTDPPGTVVRRFNPTLRMAGLSFGRWRLRGNRIELWGLEDPSVPEERKKYSFRMSLDLKSTARGRMNKLVMVSLATEHRQTLEVEEVPIRPSKPFYFSKVAAYAGEEGHALDDPNHA